MSSTAPLPPRSRGNAGSSAGVKKKPKRRPGRWLRLLYSLLALIIIVLVVYAGALWKQWNDSLGKISSHEADAARPIASADRAQVKPLAMLLLGMDTREQTGSLNTDVIMVIAMNPKSNTATVVSVPRDSELGMSGYKTQKVNAFYAGFRRQGERDQNLEGDKANSYAQDKMREMMGEFFDIPIDYTAVINFQGFVDVVDQLHGIDVYVDQDMKYRDTADGTNIDLQKGDQHLDGDKALDFVRYRKSNEGTAASSDFARNDRQSRVLAALVDKMKTIGGVAKLPNVIGAVGDNMRTDIPKAQINNILKTYYDINSSDVRFIPLEGEWKSPYVYLNQDKVEEAKQALAEELSPNGRAAAQTPDASPSASAGE